MNRNQFNGFIRTVKGKTKALAGRITGNQQLEQKGRVEQVHGKVESGYGDLRSDVSKIGK